jgi:para-nitrobenzyl esterase
MVTDHILRVPLHRLADARTSAAYVYEFAWPSNVPDLGACHALELGFVFDTADVPESAKLAGEGAPQELAGAMHTAWVRFAAEGDPGWAAWDASHPVRVFGTGEPHTVHGPRDRELALWDAESTRQVTSAESTPASPSPAGSPTRSTAPLSAVRRFRRSGGAPRP